MKIENNKENLENNFEYLYSLAENEELNEEVKNLRRKALKGFISALNAVLPKNLFKSKIFLEDNKLTIQNETIDLKEYSKLIIIGGGKATAQMAYALIEILGDNIPFEGIINVPHGQNVPVFLGSPQGNSQIKVNFAAHPVPDEEGVKGVQKMLELVLNSPKNSLIITLISGGGSALMPYPAKGITLDELQQVNKLLLQCGADIQEINCVRKHLSGFKGGHLSKIAYPRRIFSLILSDVVGNNLQTIASGPTVPDLTFFSQAIDICKKYGIYEKLPESVRLRLEDGERGEIPETPKPDPLIFDKTTNLVIGSAETSAHAAIDEFINMGINAEHYSETLQGEARDYGRLLVDYIPQFKPQKLPAAFIGTGEFTVTIMGKGVGGRNQEMLLSFIEELLERPNAKINKMKWVVIAGAFDGIEGNSPAMGAIVDYSTIHRIKNKNLDPQPYLDNNDSYHFFKQLKDTIETGYTGTNVNDMLLILIETL